MKFSMAKAHAKKWRKRKSKKRGACPYCRRTMSGTQSRSNTAATRDHIVPKSQGGRLRIWCCRMCNTLKGSMPLDEWEQFMADNPYWHRRPEFQCGTLQQVSQHT